MKFSLRRTVTVSAQAVRSTWGVIGVTLLLILVIEMGFRIKQQLSGELVSNPPLPASYAKSDWYEDFNRDYDAARILRWKPYVYFGRVPSVHGRYVNVDSFGRRETPQPSTPAVPAARVFFFGGSTMWGTAQRDDHTIPAEASRRLQALAGPGQRIDVTNFGESGYVSTQGLIELILQLRAGNRPDVVVFYDGINDAFSTVQEGRPGIAQNEGKRVSEFAMGRQLDRTGYARGFRKDASSLGLLTVTAFRQLALVDWVLNLAPQRTPPPISVDSALHATVRVYSENMRAVEALSKEYGFTAIYVWQSSLHGTEKKLTPYESRFMKSITSNPVQNRIREVYLAAPPLLDSVMKPLAGNRFVDETNVFLNDTSEVYFDRLGHNMESSVPAIVDGFWKVLEQTIVNRQHASAAALKNSPKPGLVESASQTTRSRKN